MDSSVSPKDEIWFLRVCHHVSNAVYQFTKLQKATYLTVTTQKSGFCGLGISALAFGTQVRGFKPDRSRRILQGEKILSAPSFGREIKPWIPCR
jgi:hypothetical protein